MNAPFTPPSLARAPFGAFVSDGDTRDAARGVADGFGWPAESVHAGGMRAAMQALAMAPSPAVLLVDLSDTADPLDDLNGLAEVCEAGTIVIACGTINDIRFYRDLIASGIHDYLHKPVTEEHLREAIQSAQAATAGVRGGDAPGDTPHLMTAVIGVRGGVGGSTVAVSTAWLLSERRRRTALLDLDVHFGTGALALDLEPGRGLTDAIDNPGRIDGLFIERALVRHNERLAVLSAEAPIAQPPSGDGSAFLHLQEEIGGAFACSLIDLPRHMLVQHPSLVRAATSAIVVTELTLAAARDTIRILSWLKTNAPATRVLLVANKVPAPGQEEVARKEFEKSVEHKLDLMLPIDHKLAVRAAKLGKPLAEVAKGAKLGQELARIADILLGTDASAGRPGGSLIARLGDMRALLPRKAKAGAAAPAS